VQRLKNRLDHTAHGWALLTMRVPAIRKLANHRYRISDICESYSLATLHLRGLIAEDGDVTLINEYEEIVASIEQEAQYYLETWIEREHLN